MLYKYCPFERLDILKNASIRFTQPSDLNDPYDCRPRFEHLSKAEWEKWLPEGPTPEGYTGTPYRILTPQALSKMLEPIVSGLQAEITHHQQLESAYSLDPQTIAQRTFDAKFGILCLTEIPDSPLMWHIYAAGHTGFVLQFDNSHDFFRSSEDEEYKFDLRRVEYSTHRYVASPSTIHNQECYYRKSLDWAQEREWRFIKPLTAGRNIVHKNGNKCPVYLFDLPPDAIRGIIIGRQASSEDRRSLHETLGQPPLRHVKIHNVILSQDTYELEIDPSIDGRPPKNPLSGRTHTAR